MEGGDTPWSQAIAILLEQANCSRRKAAQRHLSPYSAFSQWKTSKQGPSVAVLDRLLRGLGLTWHDWATAFEAIPPTRRAASQPIQKKRQVPIVKDKPPLKLVK